MTQFGNVYLLDDDPSMGESLTRVMSTLGYKVKAFSNPLKFLEFDDFNSPGVILMDMQMPHLRGVEVQEKLMDRGVQMPIIFISGESQPLDIIRAMKNGSSDFLLKPFDLDRLVDALDKALANDREQVQKLRTQGNESSEEAQKNSAFEKKLREAIREGLIIPHYQPKVDLRTGEIIGFEALARWSDREMGEISPAQFVPFAEKTWLIQALTESIAERVLKDYSVIQQAFPGTRVGINISPDLLADNRLFQFFAKYLDQFEGDFSGFDLEVIESQTISENQAAQSALQSLIGIGFSTTIDDFGKQHSSLARLANLPFQCLKIDRIFVANLGLGGHEESIMKSVIALASELKLSVIAEGVETEEQRKRLIELGCQQAQGWLFAKAMALENILKLPKSLPV